MNTEQTRACVEGYGSWWDSSADMEDAYRAGFAAGLEFAARPVDVILYCPRCGHQHVDAPEPKTGWTNPPHRSHLCHMCGAIWRPADVPTNGVAEVKTRGEKDTA